MDGDAATEGEAPRAVGNARDADAKTDAAPPPIDAKAKRHRRRGGLLPPPALRELIAASPSPEKKETREDAKTLGMSDEATATATTLLSTTASRSDNDFEDAQVKVTESLPAGPGSSPARGSRAEGSPAPAPEDAAPLESRAGDDVSSETKSAERDDESSVQPKACVSEEAATRDFEARVAEAVAKALEAKDADLVASRKARETEKEAPFDPSARPLAAGSSVRSRSGANAKPCVSGRVASRETDGFRREIDGLKKDLERQKERCASFEAKFKAAARERAAATAEKADVEKALRRAEAKADAESKLSERRDKASEQKHERLATQLEERKNAFLASEKETRRLQALISQHEREKNDAVEARAAADAALEPLKVKLAEALKNAEHFREEASHASEQAEASLKDAASSRAEMRTLDAVRLELEEARAEAAAATAARVARDGVVGAELRDAQRRLAEWCATSAETEEELERVKKELVDVLKSVETLEKSVEDLRVKRAAAETDAADARANLEKAENERDASVAALERTRREFDPDQVEQMRRTLRDTETALKASREENAALAIAFRETEGILEEAVGRAEEETGARHALELALAARASGEKERLKALNGELVSERRSVVDLERRAVRAEDRLRETERQLAKTRAEAAVGVKLSAPPPGAGPFIDAAETTPCASNATKISSSTTHQDDASSLRLELKARNRQTHKLQEVCAGLKRRFVEGGGSASAFELGRDVCEARYELKACEQKRLAERERAEQLARELEKTRRALSSVLERNQTAVGSSRHGGLAARAVNVDVDGRHPRGGEGKQTNGAFGGTMTRGGENAA